jgi:hypothetical protein
MRIIGLNGVSRSGKDEIVKIVQSVSNVPVYHLAFANKLREVVSLMYEWNIDPQSDKTIVDPYWTEKFQTEWSMRIALMTIGESIRSRMPYHWIALVDHQLSKHSHENCIVVISDVRTSDEFNYLKMKNGELWRVERDVAVKPNMGITNNLINDYDVLIENNGSLDDLRNTVIAKIGSI